MSAVTHRPPISASSAARCDWRSLAAAWVVCLAPRVVAALVLERSSDYTYFHHFVPQSAWYPFYEGFVQVAWRLAGGNDAAYVALHLAVYALLGPAVYLLAGCMGFSRLQQWLAVIGTSLLPYYVATAPRQPQVGITLALFAIVLWVGCAWKEREFALRWGVAFAGLSFLLVLLRPNALLNVLALYGLALCLAWRLRDVRRAGRIAASGVALGVLLAGVSAYNLRAHGRFTPVTDNSGYNLYLGNNEHTAAYLQRRDVGSMESVIYHYGIPPEALTNGRPDDAKLRALGVKFMREHPGVTLENMLAKAVSYWGLRLEATDRKTAAWNLAYAVPYLFYGPLAVAGCVLLWRHGQQTAVVVMLTTVLVYFLPHLVFFPTIRMRMTTEFLLLMSASYTLGAMREWWKREAARK